MMNAIENLPLAAGHMIGLVALGSCIGVGLRAGSFAEAR
jgi:F-type H+-transporting ATPase subunit c